MGQFLAVFSLDPDSVQARLTGSMKATPTLLGYSPLAFKRLGHTGVASFKRIAPKNPSGQVHTFPDQGTWCLSVGTWVHQGGMEPSQALRNMVSASHAFRSLSAEIEKIDGTYCFLIGSLKDARIHIITDPIGQLHVYTLYMARNLFVSTSALLLAQIGQCNWDMIGVREFLAKGTVFEDRSLFSGVRKLAPGSVVSFENSIKPTYQRFWSPRDHIDTNSSDAASLENFGGAVESGIERVFNTFGAPVLDITGGFDSRIILACARKVSGVDGFGTVVAGSSKEPDVIAANRIASRLNLSHQHLDAQMRTASQWLLLAQQALLLVDGEYDILEYARILNIHRQLAARYGISVNGSGGELIRGYWWELLFPNTGKRGKFDARRIARHRFATDPWAEPLLATRFPDTLLEHFTAAIERTTGDLDVYRNTACLDNVYLMLRMQRWQGRIASATNRLWPCVSPLLFRRPIEAALSASVSLRRNGRMARRLLASIDAELAKLPMADGYPATPITPRNLPYFASRRGGEIGKRVLGRLIGGRITRRNTTSTAPTLLQNLVVLDEVRTMFDPTQMLTAELYDPHALRMTINRITNHQAPAAHVGRLLTLESLARLRLRTSPGDHA